MAWKPNSKSKGILDRAWAHIQSVVYAVSLRWVLYRLLDDHTYHGKGNYKQLCELTAKARKSFFEGWRPNTLADDTREAIGHETYGDPGAPVGEEIVGLADYLDFRVSHWHYQERYLEIWFEARAMIGQFAHYTEQFAHYPRQITLRPFGGDPSIDFKWKTAKELEWAASEYGKPITIVYFGDADDKGQQIPVSALKDIREWCNVDFDFIHAGLNFEQVQRLQLPEDPERPGKWQWEGLTDEQAGEIITTAIGEYVSQEVIDETHARAMELKEEWYPRVCDALEAVAHDA